MKDDDELEMSQQLGEETVDDKTQLHDGTQEEGAAGEEDQTGQKLKDQSLAEGGEADGGEVEHGQDGQDQQQGKHKKSQKERRDQYRRAARRMREERDYALQLNAELLERLGKVEQSGLETRLLTIDGRLQECQSDADQALSLETQALSQGDAESLRSARLIREKALAKGNSLQAEKNQLLQLMQNRASQPQVRPPMPGQAKINQLASQFAEGKPWLQFRNGAPANRETAVMHAIDLAMQDEGRFASTTPEYWTELEKRGKAALPHLFGTEVDEGDDDEFDIDPVQTQTVQQKTVQRVTQTNKARGPAVAGSGKQGNAGPATYRLSAERMEALRDLGLGGPNLNAADKKERDAYIAEFRKWDKEHGVNS